MSHQFVGFENLSRNLLMHRRYGADKVVRYCDLFVLDEKDALVGFRPEAIQAFDVILSAQRRIVSGGLEDIEGMHTHHIGGKNLLITPRDFQITMSAVRLQHEPMSRVSGRLQQAVNRNIQFRNIKFWHSGPPVCARRARREPLRWRCPLFARGGRTWSVSGGSISRELLRVKS